MRLVLVPHTAMLVASPRSAHYLPSVDTDRCRNDLGDVVIPDDFAAAIPPSADVRMVLVGEAARDSPFALPIRSPSLGVDKML